MKITSNKEDVELLKQQIKKANEGCTVCPVCGEKVNIEVSSEYIPNAWGESLHFNFYYCKKCYSEWSSEKYIPSVKHSDKVVSALSLETIKEMIGNGGES